jgi:hypothetical protein
VLNFCVLSVDIGERGIFSESQNDENLKDVLYSQEDLDLISDKCLVECIRHHQFILE